MKEIVLREEAEADLQAAWSWYEARRAGLGDEMLLEVRAKLDAVAETPGLFAKIRGDVRRALVRRFPYSIFFVEESQRIVVLAVMHGARDPRTWPRN